MTLKVAKEKGLKVFDFIIHNVINILFIIVGIYYLYTCNKHLVNGIGVLDFFVYIIIIPLIVISVIVVLLKICNKNEKIFIICLIFISIALYSVWNILANTKPISDYEVLINGAKSILEGTFTNKTHDVTNYFYFYNFQIGYVLYLALIMKAFGTSLVSLKIIEILVMTITNVLVYKIAKNIWNKNIGVIASTTYTLLAFNIAGSSIINNQHVGMLFVTIAIYLIVRKKSLLNYILSAVILVLAIILRPSSIIIFIATICFFILKILKGEEKINKKFILTMVSYILVFIISIGVVENTTKAFKLAPNGIINSRLTHFKYVLGIVGNGLYGNATQTAEKTQVYFDLKDLNFDYDKYNEECKKIVREKIKIGGIDLLRAILSNKMVRFTGGFDNQIDYTELNRTDHKILAIKNFRSN